MFVGVTAEKPGPFCRGGGGAEFIQNFHKREIDIPYRGKFRREKFSLEKIFVTYPKFHHFSPTKNFSSDIINIIDLR